MAYDDYQNKSTLGWTKDGVTVDRTIYLRADTEADVISLADCPKRNDPLAVGSTIIYCSDVSVNSVPSAAAIDDKFLWEVRAKYKPIGADGGTVDKARWAVGFRPQKLHVRGVDLEEDQVHYGPEGSDASRYPVVSTAINVTDKGAQGVDIDEMVEVLTIDFWKAPADVEAFLAGLRSIKNCVNSSALTGPWGSYEAGEARLTGVSVGADKGETATISVEISISENSDDGSDSGITIFLDSLGTEVAITKTGWEYLWVRYIKDVESGGVDVRPLSIDAHVAKVYSEGDFSVLGITGDLWT